MERQKRREKTEKETGEMRVSLCGRKLCVMDGVVVEVVVDGIMWGARSWKRPRALCDHAVCVLEASARYLRPPVVGASQQRVETATIGPIYLPTTTCTSASPFCL